MLAEERTLRQCASGGEQQQDPGCMDRRTDLVNSAEQAENAADASRHPGRAQKEQNGIFLKNFETQKGAERRVWHRHGMAGWQWVGGALIMVGEWFGMVVLLFRMALYCV